MTTPQPDPPLAAGALVAIGTEQEVLEAFLIQDDDMPGLRQALSDGAANPLGRAGHDKAGRVLTGSHPRVAELSGLLPP